MLKACQSSRHFLNDSKLIKVLNCQKYTFRLIYSYENKAQTLKLPFQSSNFQIKHFSEIPALKTKEWVKVTYQKPGGDEITVKGKVGDNLLDVATNNNVDLDGFGACEGTLSCSTCHLILDKADFDKIPDPITDEELDMLDLAYGLSDTSRLGCQICLCKDVDGMVVKVPEGKSDARNS